MEQQIRESSLWMHDREKYLSIEEPEDTSSHTDAKTIGDLYPALAPEAIVSEEPAIVNVLFDMLERCCVEYDQWAKEEARLKKAAEYKARHPPPQDKYPSLDPDIVRAQGGEYVNDVVTSLYGVLERCASAVPIDLYPSLSTDTDAGTETKSSAADVATNDGVLHSLFDILEQCFRDEEADQEEVANRVGVVIGEGDGGGVLVILLTTPFVSSCPNRVSSSVTDSENDTSSAKSGRGTGLICTCTLPLCAC